MSNNEERYCNICKRETLFFLDSDMLWYCNECDSVFKANNSINDDEKLDLLSEFEEENGESIICGCCNNFIVVEEILPDGICNICQNELGDELEKKGYIYSDEECIYYKD